MSDPSILDKKRRKALAEQVEYGDIPGNDMPDVIVALLGHADAMDEREMVAEQDRVANDAILRVRTEEVRDLREALDVCLETLNLVEPHDPLWSEATVAINHPAVRRVTEEE